MQIDRLLNAFAYSQNLRQVESIKFVSLGLFISLGMLDFSFLGKPAKKIITNDKEHSSKNKVSI